MSPLKIKKDPVKEFNKKHRPESPDVVLAAGSVEEMILKEEVRNFILRLRALK